MRPSIVTLTLVALAPATARAAEPSPFEKRPNAVYGLVGLGTPLGSFGVEAERTLGAEWSVSAGGGLGRAGPQAAAMVHHLYAGDHSRVVWGVGLSAGRYLWREPFCIDSDCAKKSGTVAWANAELGGEHRFPVGFAMRYFVGYGRLIAGGLICEEGDGYVNCTTNHKDDGYNLFYTGIAVGYAF